MVYRKQEDPKSPNRQSKPPVPPKKRKKHKKRGPGAIIAVLMVLILLAGGTVGFLLLGGQDMLPLIGSPAQPYIAQGNVYALTLKPLGSDITEAGLRAYYAQAVAYAQSMGVNTLIFEGKSDISVYWRDKVFPLAPEISAQDTLLNKLDPLAILCEESKDSGVQIWVQANIFSARGYTSEMKGSVAAYSKEMGGAYNFAFAATDATYANYAVEGLTRMAHKYPIAGVVLAGLQAEEGQEISDAAAFNQGFTALLQSLKTSFAKHKIQSGVSVAFNAEGKSWLTPETAAGLGATGLVQYLLPAFEYTPNLLQNLQTWQAGEASLVPVAPATNADLVLFTAATLPQTAGGVLGAYTAMKDYPEHVGALRSTMEQTEGALPTGFDVPQTLEINYPEQNAKIRTEGLFIMGNSNPDVPLYLDGKEITRTTQNGAFGVYVTVQTGENSYHFTQDDGSSFTLTVTKPEPSSGGTSTPMPEDGTKEAQPGQAVQVASYIASALTDPNNDGSINETLYKGAVFVVQKSVQIVKYDASYGRNVKTWAYQMPSGDYILAKNCTWVEGNGQASFEGIATQSEAGGEYLNFTGSGTPAAYISYGNEDGVLKITMYNTSFTLPAGFGSEYVQSANVQPNEDGSITLALQTKNIWGYSLEYENGQTKLFLKKPPVRSASYTKPLEGVHVLLDPGHGGDDMGTPGLMWQTGPHEKDVNLATANAIAYRLRQMGAQVSMTRTDDTTLTLDERLAAQTQLKPDFFISIHHDSAELTKDLNEISGMRAFYFHPYNSPPSKEFAQNMINNVAPALGRQSAEAQWSYYYVTRTTVCASLLFEYGFLVIPTEFEHATSTEGIYAAAVATANAILQTVPAPAAPPQTETLPGQSGASTGSDATPQQPAALLAPPKQKLV